jgi:glycosyltransferase involved in cell wall biosynthesis
MIDKLISIVVPVYNTEKFVKRCFDSILNQTYQNLELIVVNDCSPGNIDNIIQSYIEADKRVRYVRHEKNEGLFHARLTGADLARGDYIAFADSDDYVTSDYYHTLLQSAEDSHSDIVVGKTIFQKQNEEKFVDTLHDCCFYFDQLSGSDVQKHFYEQKGLCYSWHTIWNKIYKKELWDRCRPYYNQISQHLIMTEDVAFSTPLFYFAKKTTAVKHDGYFYCENSSASTNIEKITINRFEKNVGDLKLSFDFCESFLTQVNAPEEYRDEFLQKVSLVLSEASQMKLWENCLMYTRKLL